MPSSVSDSCTHTHFSITLLLDRASAFSNTVVNSGTNVALVFALKETSSQVHPTNSAEALKAGWIPVCCQLWQMTGIALKYLPLQRKALKPPNSLADILQASISVPCSSHILVYFSLPFFFLQTEQSP